MTGHIIISIIFIPINAVILWVVSCLNVEPESYKKALFASSLFFIISLLGFLTFKGFHASIISNYLGGGGRTVLSFFILWWLYKYDFWSLIFMWGIWVILQIPLNILQIKILNLPWDEILYAF